MKHLLFQVAILSVLHKFNIFKFRGKKPAQEIVFQDNEPCPNCGTVLENRYCSNCGQDRLAGLPRTFKQMASAFFSIIFYDKAWKTMLKLLFRPGFLSAEYLERRLTPYTQPFKMFWVMVLSFTVVFSFNDTSTVKIYKKGEHEQHKEIELNDGKDTDFENNKSFNEYYLSENKIDEDIFLVKKIIDKENILSEIIENEENILDDNNTDEDKIKLENESIDGTFSDYFQYFPYFMLLLIPIYAAFLKLFFRKEKYAFSLHLVFTVHFHTFLFFLLLVNKLVQFILGTAFSYNDIIAVIEITLFFLTFFTIFFYSILSGIKFYNKRKKRGVVWRMLLIGFLYLFVFLFTILFLLTLINTIFDLHGIQISTGTR